MASHKQLSVDVCSEGGAAVAILVFSGVANYVPLLQKLLAHF